MKKALAVLLTVTIVAIVGTLVFAGDAFLGEWSASFTNSTATYTNSGAVGAIKKIASVWFHFDAATTATCTVSVVKGTITNNVLTDVISFVQDVQWTPRKSLWILKLDKVIVSSNSSTGCVVKVQFDK